jgi:hypothetical protein
MNKALLLGSLFLRVSSVYGAAAHGGLILEGRRRNEEAYEQSLKKENSSRVSEKNPKLAKTKKSLG